MTLNKNIQDILYFKGIIDFNKDYVKLDISDKKDNQNTCHINSLQVAKKEKHFKKVR